MKKNKLRGPSWAFWLALFLVLPLALFIYEKLAIQNQHPSLAAYLVPSSTEDEGEREDNSENKVVKREDKNEASKGKVNIKATPKVRKEEKPTRSQNNRTRSIQTDKASQQKDRTQAQGDNKAGQLELPAMAFDVDLTEELMISLLNNKQAQVIAITEEYGDFQLKVRENKLGIGRFKAIGDEDYGNLSDGVLPLPQGILRQVRSSFSVSLPFKSPSEIELRLTEPTYKKLVDIQQNQQRKYASQKVTQTTFSLSLNNEGVTDFRLMDVIRN